ncbi:MAG: glycosyltransferase family 4 protein [Ferruginibacter sp.]|nr:glycosyltransferase family 4 protein [Ferruginibacter sp.]
MGANSNVAQVIINNLGGITSLVQQLILYKGAQALPQELWILNIKTNINTPAIIDPDLHGTVNQFCIDPADNWYYTYGKLANALSKKEGILVSNDQYDLIMLQAFNIPRKVVQLVHDPYNVTLALKFHECIDIFIAHSHYIYDSLLQQLPAREGDIFHLPYGIPISASFQKKHNQYQPLQLLFIGRHDKAKGVYDLFEINRLLKEKAIPVQWTILGKGPETENLKAQWINEPNVKFETPINTEGVLQAALHNDVLVFPTKFEGFPVALLEAMSMGCVPVVTDLPGGIRELVEDGITGYKCGMDDNIAFAATIQSLHFNREFLYQLQLEVTDLVSNNFDVKKQAPLYQELFKRTAANPAAPLHHQVHKKIGSRLDQAWLPNFITQSIRKFT